MNKKNRTVINLRSHPLILSVIIKNHKVKYLKICQTYLRPKKRGLLYFDGLPQK